MGVFTSRKNRASLLTSGLGLCLMAVMTLSGCQRSASEAATPEAKTSTPAKAATKSADEKPGYSPFAVRVEGPWWAEVISFKDVGLHQRDQGARALWLETLADSVAHDLPEPLVPNMSFEPELADPMAHYACEGRHIYVDVWRASSPDRLGFSLWKGCSEDDRFHWREISVETLHTATPDTPESAVRLGQEIARTLARCPEAVCS